MINSQTVAHLRSAVLVNPVRAKTDTEAIDELLSSLRDHPDVVDANALRTAVLQRQKVDPPILPMGVAFPHARTDSVRALVLGIGICPETAVCFDCLEHLIAGGSIEPDEQVVVFNTGAAQKYPEAVPLDLPRLDKDRPLDYGALTA